MSEHSVHATVGTVGEFDVISAITASLHQPAGVHIGPGDDSAVLAAPDGRVVVSCDMFVDTVHFRLDWASGEQIGTRAAIAAMADVFAMGAVPTGLVVALSVPTDTATELITDIGRGIARAASDYGAGLVGGDLVRSTVLAMSVTVLGDLRGLAPVQRNGAQPGDIVALAGRIGWAAAGLDVLSRGFRSPAAVVSAYRVPEPPLTAGPVAAAAGATAMIDISDGLLADLGHIAVASDVHIDLASNALPIPPKLVEVASALGKDPRSWLLTGGEDHALAATFPAGTSVPAPWQQIGTVRARADNAAPVTVDNAAFESPGGFEHFRQS